VNYQFGLEAREDFVYAAQWCLAEGGQTLADHLKNT
jgi:hypothetical protein